MNTTILETKEDLQWARNVHGLPKTAKFAVLYGNEDAPYVIEFWTKKRPLYTDPSQKYDPDTKKVLT